MCFVRTLGVERHVNGVSIGVAEVHLHAMADRVTHGANCAALSRGRAVASSSVRRNWCCQNRGAVGVVACGQSLGQPTQFAENAAIGGPLQCVDVLRGGLAGAVVGDGAFAVLYDDVLHLGEDVFEVRDGRHIRLAQTAF